MKGNKKPIKRSDSLKMRINKSFVIPVAATIIFLVPFANKAFHLDDLPFLWTAKQILVHPCDFYGFSANWYGIDSPMAEMAQNPPLAGYYIALVASIFGFNEFALHLGFLFFAVLAALGTYCLAARLCSNPTIAALATIATPVFLVSSSTCMCDTMMLAFWVWAIFFWVRGVEKKSLWYLLLSAIIIVLCALTKYFGIALFALLTVYTIAQKRKLTGELLFMLIPALFLAGYQLLTLNIYGRGLLFGAIAFSTEFGRAGSNLLPIGLTGLSFIGGCLLTALLYGPFLWSKRIFSFGVVLTILLLLIFGFLGKNAQAASASIDYLKWNFFIHFSLFIVVGGSILLMTFEDFRKQRDAGSLLLLLWVFGTYAFAAFFNWTINGRSVLAMAPAVGIILVRRLERMTSGAIAKNKGRAVIPLIPAICIALCVCWADSTFANTARSAASAINKRFAGKQKTIWFQGHWGFQYYMETAGCKAIDLKKYRPRLNDIVVIPYNNVNVNFTQEENLSLDTVFSFTPIRWLATMSEKLGSGFYSNKWGPVPYIFGPVDKNDYLVYIVK